MADRILVVDDEPDLRAAAQMVLEGEGYGFLGASSGEEALQKAEIELPDLVMLDVVMPGKSGLEVCRSLKTQPRTKHIPIVMLTVLDRDIDRKLEADAGADGHFTKPYTPDALLTEVKKYLNQARPEKFSRQLNIDHDKLRGKVLLFEFDPATRYDRIVRDFALESASHDEASIVLTKKASAVRHALEGEKTVELLDFSPNLMLSPLLEKFRSRSLGLVYDNLTDLALTVGVEATYRFAQNAVELLSESRATAIFLLNSGAHEPSFVQAIKGFFSSQLALSKEGTTTIKIT